LKGAIRKIGGLPRLGDGLLMENNVAKRALASPAPRVPERVWSKTPLPKTRHLASVWPR